jgi:ABC-type multidrug transport system ATPase subunit
VGENVVVILSTHIVEDVSDLCQRMAIIAEGRIVTTGAPSELTANLKGRIWRKVIAKAELEAARQQYVVILTRLFGGKTLIHILSDENPGNGFEPVDPGLEDVYFTSLPKNRRAA